MLLLTLLLLLDVQVLVLCMLLMSGVMAGCIHNIYKRHISIIAEPQHHHHTHMKHSQQQQQHVAHKALDKQHHAAPPAVVHSSRHRHLPGSTQAGLQGIKSVLTRNPAAAALAVTVVAFSVSYRMFEYSYKNQLRLATADSAAYCCKLADVQSAVGAATIVLMLLSRFIFKVRMQIFTLEVSRCVNTTHRLADVLLWAWPCDFYP